MPARGSEDVRWPGIISMCSLPQAHYILTECFLCCKMGQLPLRQFPSEWLSQVEWEDSWPFPTGKASTNH